MQHPVSQHLTRGLPDEGRLAQVTIRLLLLVAAIVSSWLAMARLHAAQHPYDGAALLALAVLLMLAATWRLELSFDRAAPDAAASPPPTDARLRPLALPLLLLVAALTLGAILRFYDLTSAPEGVWFDEAQNGLAADRILNDDSYRPVFITDFESTNRPALPVYLLAAATKILGTGIFALRFVSVIAALTTIAGVFYLGRELFDERVGALAALILAASRWHLTFSRLAMEPIWGPFFVTGAALFLVRALKRGGYANFVVSGVFLGLSLYFYWACLLVPIVFVGYAVHARVTGRAPAFSRLIKGGALTTAAAFLVYLPIVVYAVGHVGEYTERGSEVVITEGKSPTESVRALLDNTWDHVRMFNVNGDNNARHNLPGEPMLDAVTGGLFVLGLLFCVSRLKDSRYVLLFAWLLVLMQPAIWSKPSEAPQALRAILVTPAVALLAALPLAVLWDISQKLARTDISASSQSRPRLINPLAASTPLVAGAAVAFFATGALSFAFYDTFDTYFRHQIDTPEAWAAHDADATYVGREVHKLGADQRVLLATHYGPKRPAAAFALLNARSKPEYVGHVPDILPLTSGKPTTIFLDGSRDHDILLLRELYPEATVRVFGPSDTYVNSAGHQVFVPAAAIERLTGVRATYTAQDGAAIERRESTIDFDWTATPPLSVPFRAKWSGQLHIVESGLHTLAITVPGTASLRLNEEYVGSGTSSAAVSARLTPGLYAFEVEATIEREGNVSLTDDGEIVNGSALFAPLPENQGLLATFFSSEDFSGEPSLEKRVPLPGFFYLGDIPSSGVSSVIWSGRIRAPVSGNYVFELETPGEWAVTIDGTEVLSTALLTSTTHHLSEGQHDLAIRFSHSAGGAPQLLFFWTPPGQERQLVPRWFLSPP